MQTKNTTAHQRRNDAQLAAYRRDYPAAWQQILDTMSEAERAEAIARADAAELDAFAFEWDRRAEALASVAAALTQPYACCTPEPTPPAPRIHVTAQMIADIWQDEGGPARVAKLLRQLPAGERNRLAVDYWGLLRRRGCHELSLVEVGIQFCVVERLAA